MPPRRTSRGRGGGRRPMFKVSGILFGTREIESLIDRKSAKAFKAIGVGMRQSAQRSLRMARRYNTISEIKDAKIRQPLRIMEALWIRGDRPRPPELPFKPSAPGKIPKLRSPNSPLKKGIFYAYEPEKRGVVVGAARMAGTDGVAPRVLEHGGISNGSQIAKRGYMDKTLDRMRRNGKIQKLFAQKTRT